MPSNFEGLALMPIEAGLAKLPCIVNNCPGLGETMPPDWPLIVNDNNVDDFIHIFRNLENYERTTLQEIIFKNAVERFSITTMQEQYLKLYQDEIL
jgi:glycosyltransferase involved in cell wall biosynthesis